MAPRAPVPHLSHPALQRRAKTRFGRRLEAFLAPPLFAIACLGMVAVLVASMLQMAGPGVTVLTTASPGNTELLRTSSGTYFAVGLLERGDTTAPMLIRSAAELAELAGTRQSYGSLYDNLVTAFAEGLRRAYVIRVVGAAATKGTLTLKDGSASAGLNTLTITAKNAGSWSTQVKVAITAGNVAATFTITLLLNDEVAEIFPDLATPALAVTAITARSQLVTATNVGSATTAPDNNPRVLAATALSAGADDRAAVDDAALMAALAGFGPQLGDGAVAIPGSAASAVGAGIIAHCKAHRRTPLLAPALGTSVSAAKAEAAALRSTTGSEFAGYFWPHVKVPDGSGGTRTIDPTGYVAGVRARTHELVGPWRAPAGEIAAAQYVVGLETEPTRAEIESLADGRVNALRTVAGSVRLYGWRSLSLDTVNWVMLTGREVLNSVAVQAETLLEHYLFETIDSRGHLFAQIESELKGILEPIRAAGGLYENRDAAGQLIDPGYVIDTGPSVNTTTTLANNELRVRVGIRVSPTAELIYVTVTKVALAATF